NVVKIDLPPLRQRPEDVPLLAGHFAQKYARPGHGPCRITPEAMEALLAYHWPGNVRQLENAIERACVTARDGLVPPATLPHPAPQRDRTGAQQGGRHSGQPLPPPARATVGDHRRLRETVPLRRPEEDPRAHRPLRRNLRPVATRAHGEDFPVQD